MKTPLLIFVFALFTFGFTVDKFKQVENSSSEKSNAIALKKKLFEYLLEDKMDATEHKLLLQFYQLNNYVPVWLDHNLDNSSKADSLIQIIKNAHFYGLQPEDYNLDKLIMLREEVKTYQNNLDPNQNVLLFEILLSKSFMQFGKHLNYGKVKNIEGLTHLDRKEYNIHMPNYFANAVLKDSIFEYLFGLQPHHAEYISLQKAVETYVKQASLSGNEIVVPSYKVDSVQAMQKAKIALSNHNYLQGISSDFDFINALQRFQKDHGLTADGVVGKNTAAALSKSPLEYYQNAAISLERWRWKKDWESSYIHVNIPSFTLNYVQNDSLRLSSRVVVGKTRNRTPEIYSKLSYLVIYPYWHVPKSISVKEILVKAKSDSSYMQRNNYQIFSKDLEEVSLESVRWDTLHRKNFNFYIRQKGGSTNALGLVKFIFHNNYSIYLHDTPSKSYFKRDIRSYSHGCVRVEKAMHLTDVLLQEERNEMTMDSINYYIEKKQERKIMLAQKLPIYLQYVTCTSENNRLIFYKDIYGYDDRIRKVMFN